MPFVDPFTGEVIDGKKIAQKKFEDAGGGYGTGLEKGLRRLDQAGSALGGAVDQGIQSVLEYMGLEDSAAHKFFKEAEERNAQNIIEQQQKIEALPTSPILADMYRKADAAPNTGAAFSEALGAFIEGEGKMDFVMEQLGEQTPNLLTFGGMGKAASMGVNAATKKGTQALLKQAKEAKLAESVRKAAEKSLKRRGMATASAATGIGAGASSFTGTFGSRVAEAMGYDVSNFDEARGKAFVQSLAQAAVDGSIGAVLPFKIGPNQIANIPVQSLLQAAGGAGGEYAAAKSVGEEVSQGEMVMESLLEAFFTASDVVIATLQAKDSKDGIEAGDSTPDNGEPATDYAGSGTPLPRQMNPEAGQPVTPNRPDIPDIPAMLSEQQRQAAAMLPPGTAAPTQNREANQTTKPNEHDMPSILSMLSEQQGREAAKLSSGTSRAGSATSDPEAIEGDFIPKGEAVPEDEMVVVPTKKAGRFVLEGPNLDAYADELKALGAKKIENRWRFGEEQRNGIDAFINHHISDVNESAGALPGPANQVSVAPGKVVEGKETQAVNPTGEGRYDMKYAVVEADSLLPSHSANGVPNQDYPQALQPRDRTQQNSKDQVRRFAENPKPEKWGAEGDTGKGAPIIAADGRTVVAGNGRTATAQKSYEIGTGDKFKGWLKQNAGQFGVDPEAVANMKKPVLVRRLPEVSDSDLLKIAKDSNANAPLGKKSNQSESSDSGVATKGSGGTGKVDSLESVIEAAGSSQMVYYRVPDGQVDRARIAKELERPDLAKKVHTVRSDYVHHTFLDHGEGREKLADQIPVTPADILKIPDILKNFDSVELSKDRTNEGREAVIFKKRYNGTTIYIESVMSGRRRPVMTAQTMYKKRSDSQNAEGSVALGAAEQGSGLPHNAQSEPRSPSTDTSISRESDEKQDRPESGVSTSDEVQAKTAPRQRDNPNEPKDRPDDRGSQGEAGTTTQEGEASKGSNEVKGESKAAESAGNEHASEGKLAGSTDQETDSSVEGDVAESDLADNTEATPKQKARTGKVSDAGEELKANRRNQITWADIEKAEDAEKVRLATKTKLWPRPKYEALVSEQGVPVETAYLVKTIYDGIASKPRDTDDATLKRYAEVVGEIREATEAAIAANTPAEKFSEAIRRKVFPDNHTGSPWGRLNKEGNAKVVTVGANKLANALTAPLRTALRKMPEGWPAKLDGWQAKYIVEQIQNGRWALRTRQARTIQGIFDTEAEAIAAAEKRATVKRKATFKEPKLDLATAVRLGPEARKAGHDISSDELLKTYGFRGVNFGNWMNNSERQSHLNAAYDAFHDLAHVLNLPGKALSFGGKLGIAFGAQGKGKAAAHFVPGANEINITKTSGGGALAHEWGHAFDYHYAVIAGKAREADPFLSEQVSFVEATKEAGELRPEIQQAFKTIANEMRTKTVVFTPEEMQQELEKSRALNNEKLAMVVERLGLDTNDKAINAALETIRNGASDLYLNIRVGGSSLLVLLPVRNLAVAAKLNATSISQIQSIARSLMLARSMEQFQKIHTPQQARRTAYNANARNLDRNSKKPYWSSSLEMFARAFESYVLDRLASQGRQNDYLTDAWKGLVSQDPEAGPVTNHASKAYPQGGERQTINAAFDSLVAELRTKTEVDPVTDEERVTLYRRGKADSKPKGLPVGIVDGIAKRFIRKYKGASGATIKVYRTQAEAFGHDATGMIKGAYDPQADTIILVADNHDNAADVTATLQHEVLVHKGLGLLSKPELNQLLGKMRQLAKESDSLGSLLKEIESTYPNTPERVLVEELIARIAERRMTFTGSVLARLRAIFKPLLEAFGFKISAERQIMDEVYRLGDMLRQGQRPRPRKLFGSRPITEKPESAYLTLENHTVERAQGRTRLGFDDWVLVRSRDFKNVMGNWEPLAALHWGLTGEPLAEITEAEQKASDNQPENSGISGFTSLKGRWLEATGRSTVDHPAIGKVTIDADALSGSLWHGDNRDKRAIVDRLPELLQSAWYAGMLPETHSKPRALILLAPIKAGDDRALLVGEVRKDSNTSRMYVHLVVVPEKIPAISWPLIRKSRFQADRAKAASRPRQRGRYGSDGTANGAESQSIRIMDGQGDIAQFLNGLANQPPAMDLNAGTLEPSQIAIRQYRKYVSENSDRLPQHQAKHNIYHRKNGDSEARARLEDRPSGGMDYGKLTALSGRLSGFFKAAKVKAVRSYADLPAEIRAWADKKGYADTIQAVYHEGKAYLIADRIPDTRTAVKAVLHEVVGHHGMKGMLAGNLGATLDEVYRSVKSSERFKAIARRYRLKPDSKTAKRHEVVEEYLAHLAESDPKDTLVDKVIKRIARLIRKHLMPNITLTNAEIRELIIHAHAYARGGRVPLDPTIYTESRASLSPMKSAKGNVKKGRQAMIKLLTEGADVEKAMYRNDIGWIDFRYGEFGKWPPSAKGRRKGGSGIVHILEARMRKDSLSREDAIRFAVEKLPEVIARGHQTKSDFETAIEPVAGGAIFLKHQKYGVYLVKNEHANAWVVTAFEVWPDDGQAVHLPNPPTQYDTTLHRAGLVAGLSSIQSELDAEINSDEPRARLRVPDMNPVQPAVTRSALEADETLAERTIRKMADKLRVLKVTQERVKQTGGRIDQSNDAYLAEELFHGKAEADLKDFEANHIKPFADELSAQGLTQKELDEYLVARHAEERNRYIASINEKLPDGGSGMMTAEAKQILARIHSGPKADAYRKAAKRVYDILAMQRDLYRDHGLESDEVIDQWESSYKNYVPLKTNSKGGGTGQGYNIGGKESREAKGRRSMADSPSTFAITDTTKAIIRKRKNEVGRKLLQMVKDNPDPSFWQVFTHDNPDKHEVIVKRKVDGKTVKKVEERAVQMAMMRDNYFQTKVDGEVHFIKLHDPRLMAAMKSVGPDTSNFIISGLGKINRFLSAVNTSFSPEFAVSNFGRDVQTAILNLKAEQTRDDGKIKGEAIASQTVKDIPAALKAVYRGLREKGFKGVSPEWEQYFRDFINDGAKTGYFDMKDLNEQAAEIEALIRYANGGKKEKALQALKIVGRFVEDANGAIENAVRLSAYANARKAGISREQAASLAKNMTVNFNRRGEVGTTLNALYMFANASIQGSMNFGRTMVTLKGKKGDKPWSRLNSAQKIAVGIIAGSYAMALINRAAAGEDEDGENWYDKIPSYEKERNYIIMQSIFGGEPGKYWKIPAPYGYNVFNVLGTTLEGVTTGTTSIAEGAADLAFATLGSFSPIGFQDSESMPGAIVKNAAPTVAKPFVDVAMNENFMGASIYTENFPFGTPKPDSSLARRTTPEGYKAIAKWLNEVSGGSEYRSGSMDINPDVLRYFVDFATGGAGGFFASRAPDNLFKWWEDVPQGWEDLAFTRKVLGNVRPYGDQDTFYERRDELGQIATEFKELGGTEKAEFFEANAGKIRLQRQTKLYEARLKRLRDERERVRATDLAPGAKARVINALDERIEAVIDSFNRQYNEAA